MATVAPPTPPRTKSDARLDDALGRAVGRIRANDLWAGTLALAVLGLAYTAGMVLLDRWLVLPMPVRQAALAGFAVCLAGVGYLGLVRPLRRRVNPRFAARRVEGTLPGSKNAVINWVDLRERELAPTVRAAVGRSAAGTLDAADVAKATEARPVVWLGAAAGLLAALLAVLFVALRPAPFASLVKRTFSPFVARDIATRTTLTLTEPAGGDVTVTAGEPLTVAVDVGGSVPDPAGPGRLRLQVWHADTATEVDELPLEPGPDRDWRLVVPPSVVQNGFSYRVVGGDARTADHRVGVRSRPLVTAYEVRYEAPAYTRIPPETAREPKLEGYRGTRVTLVARTNRPVKRGWLQLSTRPDPLPATADGDALRFDLTLQDSGTYRLGFTSTGDETSDPTPAFPVNVLTDQPPTLVINTPAPKPAGGAGLPGPAPEPDTITLPANGTLAVDGEVADDFGLVGVVLRMEAIKPSKVTLQPKPYRDGKSFRRADGSYPTRLADGPDSATGYKETVDLAALNLADGRPLPKDDNLVIEYWLEATDNCTEPKPNVGTSARKRVRVTPAVVDPPAKKELDKQAGDRKAEQQKHEAKQDEQLDAEKRDPKQVRPDPNQKPADAQPEEGQPGDGQGKGQQKGDGKQPDPNGGEPQPGGTAGKPDDKRPSDPKTPPEGKSGEPKGEGDPQAGGVPPKGQSGKPKPGQSGDKGPGQSGAGGGEPSAAAKKADEQARTVDEAIRQQQGVEQKPDKAPPPRPAGGGQQGQKQPAGGGQPAPSDVTGKEQERQKQEAIDDLSSDDPARKQAARDKLDQTVGKDERERVEKLQKDLASDDPKVREQAEKELGELDRETGTGGAGVRANRPEAVERLSRELNSPDPTTRKNAERRADRDHGQQDRDKLKEAGKNLDSTDPKAREDAKRDVDELSKKPKQKPDPQAGGAGPKPDGKPSPGEQVRQQANDLNSTDPGKKDAAEKAMDGKMGPDAGKDIQKKLGSGDPKQEQAGREQVERMAQKADQQGGEGSKKPADAGKTAEQPAGKEDGGGEKPKGPTKEQLDRAAKTAEGLTSSDPAERQAAERQADAQMGKAKRQQLQKDLDALKNGSPAEQAAAANDLEKMAKDAADKAGQQPPTPEQAAELAKAARDLNSPDPERKKAAEEAVDKAVGQPTREKLQQDQAAKRPDPQAARDATAQAMAGDKKGGKPDPAAAQKAKDVADAAKDLASPDTDKKAAARGKLDELVGKEAREQAEREADKLKQDLQSPDAKTREAAQQRVKDVLEKLKGDKTGPDQPFRPGPGGRASDGPGERYEDDPANRLKTAELQLQRFERNKGNKALLDKLGYTQAEYDRFVAEQQRRVEQLRQEAARPKELLPAPRPADAAPTVRVGEGSKGPPDRKGTDAGPGGAAGGTAAPGYTDAQRKFAAQAAKGGKPPEAPKK